MHDVTSFSKIEKCPFGMKYEVVSPATSFRKVF